jgi:AraC-like DNA-binding protein
MPETYSHSSDVGAWQMVVGAPHPALRGYVREYVGGFEDCVPGLVRRELPGDLAPIIFNFGPPFRLFDQSDGSRWTEHRSFIAGAFDTYVLVGVTGPYEVLQVNFTLLGLRLMLGRPIAELTNQVVELSDVFGADADRLSARLYETPSWAARFALLDSEILARIAKSRAVPAPVIGSYHCLVRSGGAISIGRLAHASGCSQKHLIGQFASNIGLTPKVFARVLRFGRAAKLLAGDDRRALTDIALDCGYYDQSHFIRDFRAFAGVTPSALLESRLPNHGGFAVTG